MHTSAPPWCKALAGLQQLKLRNNDPLKRHAIRPETWDRLQQRFGAALKA
jgi:hypothetical protein